MNTYEILRQVWPHCPSTKLKIYTPYIEKTAIAYSITTQLRFAAWIAQIGVESAELKYMQEIASGDAYDTRTDLGNTKARDGDGRLFKGHGAIQITGKANHEAYSEYIAIHRHVGPMDFVKFPQSLAELPYCIDSAGWFFAVYKNLNQLADQRKILKISIRVNGANKKTGLPNGWPERKTYYERALRVIPEDWTLIPSTDAPRPVVHEVSVLPDNTPADIDETVNIPTEESPETESEVVGVTPNTKTPSDAIYRPNSGTPAPQTIVRESPSSFTKWMVGIKTAVGAFIATVSAWLGGGKLQEGLTTKVVDTVDANPMSTLIIVACYTLLGVGAGIFLMWIASLFYDRSANRSAKLNSEKMQFAASQTASTVEFHNGAGNNTEGG